MALPQGFVLEKSSGLPAGFVIDQGNIISGDVPTVVGQVPNPSVIEQKRTMMDRVKALYEVPATMLSGAALTVPSAVSALVTGEPPMAMANRNMFQPTSPVSQDVLLVRLKRLNCHQ
jgi:hypothetical protein